MRHALLTLTFAALTTLGAAVPARAQFAIGAGNPYGYGGYGHGYGAPLSGYYSSGYFGLAVPGVGIQSYVPPLGYAPWYGGYGYPAYRYGFGYPAYGYGRWGVPYRGFGRMYGGPRYGYRW